MEERREHTAEDAMEEAVEDAGEDTAAERSATGDLHDPDPDERAEGSSAPVAGKGEKRDPALCRATTACGAPCRYRAAVPGGTCRVHEGVERRAAARAASCQECAVCLCAMDRRAARFDLSCGHSFHRQCMRSWFRGRPLTCPLCRTVALEGMALLGGRLVTPKLRALLRTLPPPPGKHFTSYVIEHLESPAVRDALGRDAALLDTLANFVLDSFDERTFFERIRMHGL